MNGKYVTTIFISLLLFVNTFIFISLHNHDDNLQEDNIVFYSYDYDIYYQNVEFLSGEILHAELYETIRNHTVVSYNSVWEHLREVDEDPLNNANVILFYMQRSQSENDTCGDGNECTSQSWNREHVWPKSHGDFGTSMTKAAGTDLHSLRPVDNTVNSARSNKDFGNATNSHWECTECDSSADFWEPSDVTKGDAARSVFYMDVRYNGFGNEPNLSLVNGTTQTSLDDGFLGDLCTLYHWHILDPVSSYEANRNNEIFGIQGNRNPFIDNEDFVQAIWGEICDPQTQEEDSDNDGILDSNDICPDEASTGYDVNEDGCLDDTDGDGVTDDLDIFPLNSSESIDSDFDGVGDNSDAFPNNPLESRDSDSDGIGDNSDMFPFDASEILDSDLDGFGDNSDVFPNNSLEWIDADSDGVGDNSDAFPLDSLETLDSDSDGIGDNSDVFPNNYSEWIDTDSDGFGDNSDAFPLDPLENLDSDSDGVGDNSDLFPDNSSEWIDSDSDGIGDNSDLFPYFPYEWLDSDSDGIGDNSDAFPNNSSEWIDTDSDGVGDNLDAFPIDPLENLDSDSDGVGDNSDKFPFDSKRHGDKNPNNASLFLIFTSILVTFVIIRSKL